MIDLLGEALLEQFRRGLPQRAPAPAELLDWLRKVATPPPGVELHSADGAAFTGMVIVDRNRPILMLGAWQAPAPRSYAISPSPPSSPPQGYPYGAQRTLFDEDEEPYWRCGQAAWRG